MKRERLHAAQLQRVHDVVSKRPRHDRAHTGRTAGKQTLVELEAHAPFGADPGALVTRVHDLLPRLVAANTAKDAHTSANIASQIEHCLENITRAVGHDYLDVVRTAEPYLAGAFRPSVDAEIRMSIGSEAAFEREAAAWAGTRSPSAIAEAALAGPGERLPHFEQIHASFGTHDISGIHAHIGGVAGDAARQLGAHAFAYGDGVAFASTPDLFTAAHEAAHVVQQRAGVALRGELDRPGDEYEQHADAVAHAVVRGGSATALLDRMAGRGASARPSDAVVQRKTDGASTPAPEHSAFSVYLDIHGADLRKVLAEQLSAAPWPDPAEDVAWVPGGDRAFGAVLGQQVGSALGRGEAAVVQLLYPSDVVELFHRVVKLDHAGWSTELALGLSGLAEQAAVWSLRTRIGPRYREALARSSNVPAANDLAVTYPMDALVATALTQPGAADISNVATSDGHVPAGPKPARDTAAVPTREQLQNVDTKIGRLLDEIRTQVRPAGFASKLEHAFAQRAARMQSLATGDGPTRERLAPVLEFQHAQLLTLAPRIQSTVAAFLPIDLALEVTNNDAQRQQHDRLRSVLKRLVEAADVSYLRDESTEILASISQDEQIEQDAASEAELDDATDQAIKATGSSSAGAAVAQERAEHQRHVTITGSRASRSKYERTKTETMAGEVALESRVKSVETALVQLQAAADDAGFSDPAALRQLVPNIPKSVPELLADVRSHLDNVEDAWKHATDDGTPAVQEDPNAPDDWADWQGRVAGLAAARSAFAKIAGEQDIGEFLHDCAEKIRDQQMLHAITQLAAALLVTMATGMGAAQLGRMAAAALTAESAALTADGAAIGEDAAVAVKGASTAAHVTAFAVDVGINVSINSAVQLAQSGGPGSVGWTVLENGLMEVFSRGLLAPLRAAQEAAVKEARAFASLPNLTTAERAAVSKVDFVGTELAADLIAGSATQWAAHLIVAHAHPSVEVTEPFAETVLEQGAAIAVGRFFHGKLAAWHAHRAALERTPLGAFPEARSLFDARERFYARAKALADSVSPDPGEGKALQDEHERLLAQETALLAKHVQEVPHENHAAANDTHEPPSRSHEDHPPRTEQHEPPKNQKPHPKRTLDDFLGKDPTHDELEQAKAQAKGEATMSLDDQAKSIEIGKVRSERDMLLAIKNGELPRYLARVGPVSRYATFANPKRPFVFATEPADLRGLSAAEAMWRVGWTREWIEGSVGKEIEIVVFDTSEAVRQQTEGAETIARVEVGHVEWNDIEREAFADSDFLVAAKEKGVSKEDLAALFSRSNGATMSEAIERVGPELAPKMRVVMALMDSLWSANKLYTGIGATMTEGHELGGREVMARPNGTGLKLTDANSRRIPMGALQKSDVEKVFASKEHQSK